METNVDHIVVEPRPTGRSSGAIATGATRPDGPADIAPPARSHAEVERGVGRLPFSKSQRCYLPK
jgi:hypothetical protein